MHLLQLSLFMHKSHIQWSNDDGKRKMSCQGWSSQSQYLFEIHYKNNKCVLHQIDIYNEFIKKLIPNIDSKCHQDRIWMHKLDINPSIDYPNVISHLVAIFNGEEFGDYYTSAN
jgi:hypothetical protein